MLDLSFPRRYFPLLLAIGASLTAACVAPAPKQQAPGAPSAAGTVQPSTTTVSVSTGPALHLVPLAEWPQFHDAMDSVSLSKAIKKSLAYLEAQPERTSYRIGDKDVAVGELAATAEELMRIAMTSKNDQDFNARLRDEFDLTSLWGRMEKAGLYSPPTISQCCQLA